jgi:hypothetical protein
MVSFTEKNLRARPSGSITLSVHLCFSFTFRHTRMIEGMVHMKKKTVMLILGLGVVLSMSSLSSGQWVQTNGPAGGRTNTIAGEGSTVFSGTMQGSIYRSTDFGAAWATVNTGRTSTDVLSLLVRGENVLAGTLSGLYLSTNGGTGWITVDSGLTNSSVLSLAVSGTTVFAGTNGGGVFSSTNNDSSWSPVDIALSKSLVYALAVNGSTVFAGTYHTGVFRSMNTGATWSAASAGLTDSNVYALAASGTNIYAGTWGGGVFLSANNGDNWTAVNTGLWSVVNAPNAKIYVPSLAVSGNTIFAATDSGGVFFSKDNGTSWTTFNTGLASAKIWSLSVIGNYIFAGAYYGGIWRRPLSETGTIGSGSAAEMPGRNTIGVRHAADGIVIGFSLKYSNQVVLEIYDPSGRVAARLVSGALRAGSYEYSWNTRDVATGYYVAKLAVGKNRYLRSAPVFCR